MKITKHVKNQAEASALMWFLVKEIERHKKDIKKAYKDVIRLSIKWKVPIPKDVDPDIWVIP